jgi:hypothetical protein
VGDPINGDSRPCKKTRPCVGWQYCVWSRLRVNPLGPDPGGWRSGWPAPDRPLDAILAVCGRTFARAIVFYKTNASRHPSDMHPRVWETKRGSLRSSTRATVDRFAGGGLCAALPAGAGGPLPPLSSPAGSPAGLRTISRAARRRPVLAARSNSFALPGSTSIPLPPSRDAISLRRQGSRSPLKTGYMRPCFVIVRPQRPSPTSAM